MVELDLVGRTLGGYRVGELLGRGAFGWVYRARQLSLDRAVALKVLDPVVARSPDAARRFDREGRSAAALDHPAIVDVYQAGAADGLHFLAMRMVDGIALDQVLARGPMPPGDLLAVLDRIGPALDHAHAAGIVHRDVKPANILLEQGDPRRAWLGDFGIALSLRSADDLSTTTLGTAYYMAPEQVDPPRIGPAADQYSLACVAYEALTGRRPFPGDDVMAILMSHRTNPVPSTGFAAVDAVLATALAKFPHQRHPTVTGFVHALRDALVVTRPKPPRPRRRWLALTAAAVLAAGGITTAALLPDTPTAPNDWRTVTAPGAATLSVPPDWVQATSGPITRFTRSGEQVLIVGTDHPGGQVDPSADLRRLYDCTPEPHTLPAGPAASCTAAGKHTTVVAHAETAIRLTFAPTVPQPDRTRILTTLTLPT